MSDEFAGTTLGGLKVLVTGAGSGIGRAVALTAARRGAVVACADLDGDAATSTAEEIDNAGSKATAVSVNVADEASVAAMSGAVLSSIGAVDALVNCAGIASRGSVLDVELEAWDRVMAINLRGTWLCSRAVLPGMIAQGLGSIVNISSISALIGTPTTAAYAASKAGVLGLTRQMAVDFGRSGVRVNAVCPGTVDTPLSRGKWVTAGLDEVAIAERFAETATRNALGRTGQADDIAAMVLFLAGPESSWITGCVYTVDGGTVTTRSW